MMFRWTDEMVRFMEDASRRSDYFPRLADILSPYLEGCKTICDAGCGLGQLSEELGRRGYQVTAADLSDNAISYVEGRKYLNVTPLKCDLLTLEREEKFDAMVFNYFGSIDEVLEIGARLCKGPLLIIKKNYSSHRFSFSDNPIVGYTASRAEDWLRAQGVSYRKELFDLEMGQPFRTLEEAVRFFEIYSRDKDRSLISRENVLSRLVRSGDPEFPWYMPHRKSSMLLVVDDFKVYWKS